MKTPLGIRFAALVIDYLFVWALQLYLIVRYGRPTEDGSLGISLFSTPGLCLIGFWTLWLVIPEWLWGATLGKKIFGLRVTSASGGPLSFGSALGRRLCDLFDFWASFGIVAAICRSKSPLGQRLGDRAADAIVVRKS